MMSYKLIDELDRVVQIIFIHTYPDMLFCLISESYTGGIFLKDVIENLTEHYKLNDTKLITLNLQRLVIRKHIFALA